MYTQCPECRTIFEIDEDALQASLGIVRCGHCSQRFDALRTLSNSLPTNADAALPAQDPEALAPTLTEAVSPDAIKAASSRRRERKPAAKASSPTAPPAADPDADWLTPAAARTRALLAEAAGIPHDAIAADSDWPIDLPIQTELDIIPMATDATAVEPNTAIAAESAVTPLGPADAAIEVVDIDAATAAVRPTPDASTDSTPTIVVDTAADADDSAPVADAPTDAESFSAPIHSDTEPADADNPAAAPLYVPPRHHRSYLRDGLWALGCLLLGAILAGQLAWAQRTTLMLNPATRPWVLRACANFDCRLPPIRDTAKLELLSRDIRPDPKAAGALMITATVRNAAAFTQPWPVVVVKLSDLDNNPVAMRRFRPADYMPDPTRRAAGIAPGTTAAVAFEVADPGQRAVAFSFSFE